jgi:hypothetical protein
VRRLLTLTGLDWTIPHLRHPRPSVGGRPALILGQASSDRRDSAR